MALCKRADGHQLQNFHADILWLVKHKIKVAHVGLPNILLGKEAVPELLQGDATPENKPAAAMLDWYRNPDKVAQVQQDFRHLHEMLKLDTDKLAADAVLAQAA